MGKGWAGLRGGNDETDLTARNGSLRSAVAMLVLEDSFVVARDLGRLTLVVDVGGVEFTAYVEVAGTECVAVGDDAVETRGTHGGAPFGGGGEVLDGGWKVAVGGFVARNETSYEGHDVAEVESVEGSEEDVLGHGEFENDDLAADL